MDFKVKENYGNRHELSKIKVKENHGICYE